MKDRFEYQEIIKRLEVELAEEKRLRAVSETPLARVPADWPQMVTINISKPTIEYADGKSGPWRANMAYNPDPSFRNAMAATINVSPTLMSVSTKVAMTDEEADAIAGTHLGGAWQVWERPHTPASEEDPDAVAGQRGGVWRAPVVAAAVQCPSCQGQRMKRLESGSHYCPTCSWHGKVSK